ncbi:MULTISPECIES: subtype B tannase [unclassified Neisseria]|uniref:subtype B tannase n=1 Tax=unclassified Neisseria TaxID=2623750 RepID=UPI00107251D5|nr:MULTISPECIES: subtype B tannase [unclassified Neisseria]MBF0804352.1 alpha/beta hydrolase [Neisseria sp. 19428wB4_WF04]TFU42883.1 alpha/beta hydrolase [Neisseria sp. WF04]
MKKTALALIAASFAFSLTACSAPKAGTAQNGDLGFAKQTSTKQSSEINGRTVHYRAFEGIVYVNNPADAEYETLNIYVPEAYYSGGSIEGYTAENAPIFFPNPIGGYMPAKAGKPGHDPRNNNRPNAILTALSKGYVVASAGARGRTAASVDLKAAVRYLKANDHAMPGDAAKIIANGTSSGGALSALLGAAGNSKDYEGRLKDLGAAEAPDDVFAVSAYCPITDPGHADMAYEWQFNGINTYKKINITMLDYNVKRELVPGTLTAAEIKLSDQLKPLYPAYLNSLKLKDPQGRALTLDKNGNGSFKNHIAGLLGASAQQQLDAGKNLGKRNWLTVKNGKVTAVDFDQYARAAGRQKTPPAFDAVDLSSGENQLFGSAAADKRHFTDFAMQHSAAENAALADAQTVNMMNPLHYIGSSGAQTSRHWRIRTGTNDRDTSLAVSAVLAAKLQNHGHNVDYFLPWEVGHGGDYDLEELFAWIKQISTAG